MKSSDPKGFSRRQFTFAGLALIGGVAVDPSGLLAAQQRRGRKKAAAAKIPIAVQLYSVRNECKRDLPGTLAGVAKIGYQGVEFAGYYERSADELKKMLDDNGLKVAGTHTQLDTLLGEKLEPAIEFNKGIGNKNLIVPGLPAKYTNSKEAWLETAKVFNEVSAKVKEKGMRVGYHNHVNEFKPIDDAVPFDVFFGNTGKDVIMQLDVGHALHGGADPVAVLNKYAGRAITVHVKEYSEKKGALVGEGDVKWEDVFRACETIGGTEWYILEEESNAYPALEGIDKSFQNLRKMGKV